MKQKQHAKDTHQLYSAVQTPTQLRKDLLASSRDILSILKKVEEFKITRIEKTKTLLQLRKTLNEASSYHRRLLQLLPVIPLPEQKPAAQQAPASPLQRQQQKPSLDIIEQELAKIEARMKGL